jgi:hypothetical protein
MCRPYPHRAGRYRAQRERCARRRREKSPSARNCKTGIAYQNRSKADGVRGKRHSGWKPRAIREVWVRIAGQICERQMKVVSPIRDQAKGV